MFPPYRRLRRNQPPRRTCPPPGERRGRTARCIASLDSSYLYSNKYVWKEVDPLTHDGELRTAVSPERLLSRKREQPVQPDAAHEGEVRSKLVTAGHARTG